MSDIKLFRIGGSAVEEIEGRSASLEKSLQALLERHMETFLGVRFLAREYVTGKTHGGRIDSLGIDENNSPVIIEYKRFINENVINQGLFYLDWLLDHKAEFQLLVMQKCGQETSKEIDWSGTRLLCIAGDFTRYDQYAVQQINRNIELIRYRQYHDDLLLLELVNATTATTNGVGSGKSEISVTDNDGKIKKVGKTSYKTVGEYLAQSPQSLKDLFEQLSAYLMALGDDVQRKELQFYFAFKRLKNFACVEVHPGNGQLLVYVKVSPDTVDLEEGFTRDVRSIGHYGTGDLEIRLESAADFERAKCHLLTSYEAS